MVWLNDIGLEDALHKQRTTPNAVAVARIARKFGIRFSSANYEAGFKALRPSEPYIAVTVTKIWKLFPLPFGTQRTGLQKLLTTLPWDAKVLQQVASSAAGSCWEVGSAKDHPQTIMQIAGQDVMVTFVREASKNADLPQVVASSGTREHLKKKPTQSSMLDPWLTTDPWSSFRPSTAAASSSQAAPDKVRQLESRMQQSIEEAAEKLRAEMQNQDQSMECTSELQEAYEARFSRLEVGMNEMRQQNEKLEGWVTQVANGCQQTSTEVAQIRQQLGTQQQEFMQFRHETTTHAAATSQQFQELRTEMQSEMQKGFSHIAGLLEKKQRTD